jgi:hypothetical protein
MMSIQYRAFSERKWLSNSSKEPQVFTVFAGQIWFIFQRLPSPKHNLSALLFPPHNLIPLGFYIFLHLQPLVELLEMKPNVFLNVTS